MLGIFKVKYVNFGGWSPIHIIVRDGNTKMFIKWNNVIIRLKIWIEIFESK